ncbi:MAG: peptidoglycan recognition family protein [Planctomycetota bacterium]
MSVVSDFLSGITAGLRRTRRSCPKRAAVIGSTARWSITGIIIRLILLVVSVSVIVAVLIAGGIFPPTYRLSGINESRSVSLIEPPTSQALDEVLATDPTAPRRDWKYIVLHHSATTRGSAESFDVFHRHVKGWQSLGYHFVIGNGAEQGDGKIIAGPRWYSQEVGAHANSVEYNEHGIGICLVGNFNEHAPTSAQLAATRALVRRVCLEFKISASNILGHNQIRLGGSTACPGKFFPIEEFRAPTDLY